MAVVADTQRAVSVLQGLQGRLVASGEPELGEQVASMIDLLASPTFRHLLNLQQSVRQLKHHLDTGAPSQTVEDYSFAINGDLILPEVESDQEPELPYLPPSHPYAFENKVFEGDEPQMKKTAVAPVASAPAPRDEEEEQEEEEEEEGQPLTTRSIPMEEASEDLEQALRLLALGREVLSIELMKQEGRGLGFSVVGLKSENQGELGIFVQQIQKNGMAARDGRLRESDQILAINGALVDSTVSHKQAIGMLQRVKDKVNLIVARGGLHLPTPPKGEALAQAPTPHVDKEAEVPKMTLDEPQAPMVAAAAAAGALDEPLIQMNAEQDVQGAPTLGRPEPSGEEGSFIPPDIEVIDLYNQGSGLGFGIVGVRDIGIVVKTIVPGGAAEKDGRLKSGDIILRIGETDLEGMNSDQVASVLRQSGSHVQLVVARSTLSIIQPSPHPPMEGDDMEDMDDDDLEIKEEEEEEEEKGREQEQTRLPPLGLDLGQGQMMPEPLPVSPPPISLEHANVVSGQVYEAQLTKGSQGLGLSIAGFIKKTPDGGETSGIFVKKIAEGSAADIGGIIRVGDQIIEVDGVSVQDYDNKAAVDLLRQTGAVVHLRLVRFPPEVPTEVPSAPEPVITAQAAPLPDLALPSMPEPEAPAIPEDEIPMAPSPFPPQGGVMEESDVGEESFEGEMSPEEEIAIMALWQGLLGLDKDIVIAQLSKFEEGGSLGISLEGTVDINEHGQEVQPHHYIRSVIPDGPVGKTGLLAGGDELLEVNGMRLLGLKHDEVVKILKDLPQHVRLVCARHPTPIIPQAMASDESLPSTESPGRESDDVPLPTIGSPSSEMMGVEGEVAADVAAELEMTTPMLPALDDTGSSPLDLSTQSDATPSKEELWSNEIQYIELIKGDRGLGFSILDYQDPDNPAASLIVIRSLVPSGVAAQDGRLDPGDRLVSVNDSNLADCTLDEAVQVLKGTQQGLVRIGVAKPLQGVESDESQIVSATPAMVEESPSPYTTPPPFTTTPMLPDVDISPLAEAVMAQEAIEEAEREMRREEEEEEKKEEEKEVEVQQPKVEIEAPMVVAAAVSLAHSAPPPAPQQPVSPPDLVTSVTVTDGPKPAEPEAPSPEPPKPDIPAPTPSPPIAAPSAPSTPPQPKRTPPKPPPKPVFRPSRSSPRASSAYGIKGFAPVSPSRGFSTSSSSSSSSGSSGWPKRPNSFSSVSLQQQVPEERMVPRAVVTKVEPPTVGRKRSNVVLPTSLEETIVLKKTNAGLGLTVSADKSNGVVIKSIIRGGCVQQDGRLSVGDYITAVNGENMRNLNNNTARGVLRRSFLQGTDISVTYIAASKAAECLESGSTPSDSPRGTPPPTMPRPTPSPRLASSPPTGQASSPEVLQMVPTEENQWGDVKTVVVTKETGRSLGISIVGGRSGDGQVVQGIFIKHVLEDSPAGRTGQLKTGDRILEVNGCDLREATHDQAVAVIRNASNPMRFQIQSLTVGSPAAILQDDGGQGEVVAVEAKVIQAGADEPDGGGLVDRVPEGQEGREETDSESEDEFGYTWKKVSERYKDLEGELHVIELKKGDRGLGLSLAGNKDKNKTSVFVVGVNPSGAAGKDGRILIGDELLEINGIKVFGHSHQNASNIIQGLAPGTIKIILVRNKAAIKQLAVPPVIYPNQTSIQTVVERQEAFDVEDFGESSTDPAPAPVVKPTPKPEDYPNVQTIVLTKGQRGLGFAIYENQDEKGLSGIFVKDVTMGGPAAKEGHLRVGDQILAVNDKSVIGLSKLSAISVLKDTRGTVSLTISSAKPTQSPSSQPHSLFPPLEVGTSGTRGVEGGITFQTAQTDMSAPTFSTQAGIGNFFPALDLGDEPHSLYMHDSNSLDSRPSRDPGNFFPSLDPEIELQEISSSTSSFSSSHGSLDVEPSHRGDSTGFTLQLADPVPSESSTDAPPSDPLTCPVVKGHKTLIVVDCGSSARLGISIVGGVDTSQPVVMVKEVLPGEAAARDGRLQPGDQLLEVDGLDLKNATNEMALNALRQTSSKVRMVVLREDRPPQAQGESEEGGEDENVMTVVLHQPAGHSLGLSIAGKAGALYISDIVPGSVADSNGQLMRGDQILAVNGLNVKNIPQEALATLRQNAAGKVSLKVSSQTGEKGSRLSMSSLETVVSAQPVMVGQSESSTGSEGAAVDARAAFLQQAESFGSSTEMPPDETPGESVKTIVLERGPDGLGFSIVGGFGSPHGDLPIYIKTVFNRGAAAETKQLKRGNQILAVNDESLEGATHQKAVSILKQARGQVTLTIVS
ncbi:multiple PDZ domain protein-like [Diadema antillarum]|uniref:multiple PDZ domain protein-like n=1 Tax=Diadema antillarum TaxID=105358 RepID=UPI003A843685